MSVLSMWKNSSGPPNCFYPRVLRRLSSIFLLFTAICLGLRKISIIRSNTGMTNIPQYVPSNHHIIKKETSNSNNIKHLQQPKSPKMIRSWGCSLNSTPFIFVHIGKAGGGEARRTFAAAALGYDSTSSMNHQPRAYYKVYTNSTDTFSKAIFRSAKQRNFVPSSAFLRSGSMEGNMRCDAETAVGQALACPDRKKLSFLMGGGDSTECFLVYAGHNMLGNEMHWLPEGYLERWWDGTVRGGAATNNTLLPVWKDFPRPEECVAEHESVGRKKMSEKEIKNRCRDKITDQIDSIIEQAVSATLHPFPWPSPTTIHSTLPLLRVTIAREPFSWLASKYAWHHLYLKDSLLHDDIPTMTHRSRPSDGFSKHLKRQPGPGWANHFALKQIMQYCGEDCLARYVHGKMGLEELERRAEANLRHSFAVVGLLTDMEGFYRMVGARVAYMVNVAQPEDLDLRGATHRTYDKYGVRETYADGEFQERLVEASPEIAVLVRLYEVCVEVNRFQQEELRRCPSWNIREAEK